MFSNSLPCDDLKKVCLGKLNGTMLHQIEGSKYFADMDFCYIKMICQASNSNISQTTKIKALKKWLELNREDTDTKLHGARFSFILRLRQIRHRR